MAKMKNLMGTGAAAIANPPPQVETTAEQIATIPTVTSVGLSAKAQAFLAKPSYANVVVPVRPAGNYVGSLSVGATTNAEALMQAGVKDGEFYLDAGGTTYPCPELHFWLVDGQQFGTGMDTAGNITHWTDDLAIILDRTARDARRIAEHYVCLVLVDLGIKGIIPAKADFRTTKSSAGSGPISELQKMQHDNSWNWISDAHKVAAQFPQAFGRLYHICTTHPWITKGGPNKGKKSYIARSQSMPTTVEAMERLHLAMGSDKFVSDLNACATAYEERIKQIQSASKIAA